MAKKYTPVSLLKATEGPRHHDSDKSPPKFKLLRNFYSSPDDAMPTLRSDFTYESEHIEAVSAAWGGTPSTDTSDFINAIFRLRTENTIYATRFIPMTTSGGSETFRISTYDTGTAAISSSTVTGVGTEWLQNAWPGCFLVISGTWYLITAVASDTSMTIDGSATVGASSYSLYQTWHPSNAEYKLNVQEWGNYSLISAVDPSTPVDKDKIAGPWINKTDIFGSWAWTDEGSDPAHSIAFDGTNYVKSHPTNYDLYYSTDPTSGWTVGQAVDAADGRLLIGYGNSNFFGVSDDAVWDGDGDGDTWSDESATMPSPAGSVLLRAVGGLGIRSIAIYSNRDVYWNLGSLGDAWTQVADALGTSATSINVYQVSDDGTTIFAATDKGIYFTTDVTTTWTKSAISGGSGSHDVFTAIETDGTNYVAFNSSGEVYLSTDGTTFTYEERPFNNYASHMFYTGAYFIAGSINGELAYSEDGTSWQSIETDFPNIYLKYVFADTNLTSILVWTLNGSLYSGATATATEDAELTDYSPMSSEYRSKSYAAIDAYVVLAGVKEWNSDDDIWKYYPRRVRWPGPGTTDDWDGEGAGFLDCRPGTGAILDARGVGHNVVLFEEDGVGILQQMGDLDSPWGYERLKDGITLISNPLKIGDKVYFITKNGLIWVTNGVQIDQIGGFDITEFEDWDSDAGPVWLDYFETYRSLVVFRPQVTGSTHKAYLVSEDTGAITHITLPEWDDSGTAMIPKSCFVSKVPGSERLYVGYGPIAADSDHCVSIYLDCDTATQGVDTMASGVTDRWHAILQTGNIRLVGDGKTTTMVELEVETYSSGGTEEPRLTVEVKSGDESSWRGSGDNYGTITITDSAVSGSSTVFSNITQIGDDATKVITTPQPAARCRVYRHTTATDTYVLQTSGTDYTITGTSQITLTTAIETGKNIVCYWDSRPNVLMAVNDYILAQTSDSVHRITSITDYNTLLAEHYLSSGSETGTHLPAEQMDTGDGYVVLACPAKVDDLNIKLRVIPMNSSSASEISKITGLVAVHQPIEAQERKNE